jgi:hypothetical protein
MGDDPHPVTTYISRNTGKAYGVLIDGPPSYLAVIDLDGLLKAPRSGPHVVTSLPTGVVTFVKVTP